jgi:pyrophosphatase PpaX
MRPVVLLDLDGTLADTISVIVSSFQHSYRVVLEEHISETEARSWIGRPLSAVFQERNPADADELEEVYRAWNLANTPKLTKQVPGFVELVDHWVQKNRDFGVVTSKRRPIAELTLTAVGLGTKVPLLATMEDTSQHKPDPHPLLRACTELGVQPTDCLYVGDAPVDIQAAKAARMASVAVTWGAGTPRELAAAAPDALVTSVVELAAATAHPQQRNA